MTVTSAIHEVLKVNEKENTFMIVRFHVVRYADQRYHGYEWAVQRPAIYRFSQLLLCFAVITYLQQPHAFTFILPLSLDVSKK